MFFSLVGRLGLYGLFGLVALCSLQGAHELASWKLNGLSAEALRSEHGGFALEAKGMQPAVDARRGTYLRFETADARLKIPESLLPKLQDGFVVSMWLLPARTPRDATWQSLMQLESADPHRVVDYRLRWNRPVVVTRGEGGFDAGHGHIMEHGFWNHVMLSYGPQGYAARVNEGELFAGPSVATLPIDAGIRIGSGDYGGGIAQLRIFDSMPSAAEWQRIIAMDTPPEEPGGELPAPNITGMTLGELRDRSRYSVTELSQNFPPIEEWSQIDPTLQPFKLADSYAAERFPAPPAPGVHPRIYFGPDELPAICEHLRDDVLARREWELIKGRLLQLSPNRDDWDGLAGGGAELEAKRAALLAQGIRVNKRAGYHGPWVGGDFAELAAGREPESFKGKWGKQNSACKQRLFLMNLLPSEALRCLLEEDAEGGRRVAAALTTICKYFGKEHAAIIEPSDWQEIHLIVSSASIGVTYDWIYPYMTEAERTLVRQFIAKVTTGIRSIGTQEVPAIPAVTSNWTTIHMSFVPMILSIEGEEGYDAMTYQAYVEGMKKWIYVASGPLGAPFEGLAKSAYAPDWALPMAKRGDPMLGSEWSINHVRKFQLGVMLPWGNEFVMESHVGLPRREIAFKYAHPKDPVVDFIYAQTARTQRLIGANATPEWTNLRTTYSAPWELPYYLLSPLMLAADGSYDFEANRAALYQYLKREEAPLTYYSDYRGLLTTRTGWDVDAAFLYFEPRNVPGGHTFDSRNDFVFASHGRLWSTRGTYWGAEGNSERRSVILIDGKGQGHQCLPGKTLELVDEAEATFCAGDATMAYSYKAGGKSDPFYLETPNDSRLNPSKLPWMDLNWGDLPGWRWGDKGGDRHSRIAPFNPVEYAYRTVGLIKGAHPYMVLVDDLKKDEESHRYDWLMQVPLDLSLLASGINQHGVGELILGDAQGRRLKVCVFSAGETQSEFKAMMAAAKLEAYEWFHHKTPKACARLVLPLDSVLARYRIALIPYREGEDVPQVAWDRQREVASIRIGDQIDRIAMQAVEGGRSRIILDREGDSLMIGAGPR